MRQSIVCDVLVVRDDAWSHAGQIHFVHEKFVMMLEKIEKAW